MFCNQMFFSVWNYEYLCKLVYPLIFVFQYRNVIGCNVMFLLYTLLSICSVPTKCLKYHSVTKVYKSVPLLTSRKKWLLMEMITGYGNNRVAAGNAALA